MEIPQQKEEEERVRKMMDSLFERIRKSNALTEQLWLKWTQFMKHDQKKSFELSQQAVNALPKSIILNSNLTQMLIQHPNFARKDLVDLILKHALNSVPEGSSSAQLFGNLLKLLISSNQSFESFMSLYHVCF